MFTLSEKVIGLTGPMGVGKDEVAKILQRQGAYIIDADSVAHELYAFQSPVWHELIKAFGARILVRGGKINRKKLAEIVFADKRKLQELNRIVHPYLKEAIIQMIERQRTEDKGQMIVVNAAVLKEIGLVDYVAEVWLVTAPRDKRLKRLVRAGFSAKEAQRRMKIQASQKENTKIADLIIRNDGTLRQLNAKVSACLKI